MYNFFLYFDLLPFVILGTAKTDLDVFNDCLHQIEETYLPLETTWGIAKTLYFGNQSLMPTKSYMGIHERAVRAACNKFNSRPIFKACKEALENKDIELTHEQKRVLAKYVLEGTLNGLALQDSKQYENYMDDTNFIISKCKEYKTKYEVYYINLNKFCTINVCFCYSVRFLFIYFFLFRLQQVLIAW